MRPGLHIHYLSYFGGYLDLDLLIIRFQPFLQALQSVHLQTNAYSQQREKEVFKTQTELKKSCYILMRQ